MCRDLILYNYRIKIFKLILLRKREKLKNKHFFLISILNNSLFLSRDNNFFDNYNKLLFEFLFVTILQSYTTYIYF